VDSRSNSPPKHAFVGRVVRDSTMTMTEMLDYQQACDVKGLALSSAAFTEEDTETPTRRSTPDSLEESEAVSDGSKSAEDEADEEDGSYGDDEYYSFLREMAGSFEATYDEDESEDGSEDEATGEDEQPIGRKRSSSFWLDEKQGLSNPPPGACWQRPGCGLEEEKDDKEPQVSGYPSDGKGSAPCSLNAKRPQKERPPGIASRSSSTSAGSPRSPSEGNLSELSDAEDARDDHRCPLVPTPLHDHRPPVIDDYDVVKAVEQHAAERAGDSREHEKQDLLAEAFLKDAQANQLLRSVQNPSTTPELRAHYLKVHQELLEEAKGLRQTLAELK